ncbi:hypothetical protein DFH06DRAFT_1331520 [Mycena polygramma]|nr:hypothetical protein DFH06DRAFT_1331520 [Mycena polygramma]
MQKDDLATVIPLFIGLAVLMACSMGYCLLSSCLGTPILEALKSLWEFLVLSAQSGGDRTLQSRRRAAQGRFSEVQEEWEMNYRGDRHY